MPRIYSTLGNSNVYTIYHPSDKEGKNVPVVAKQVHINGGSGLADKHFVTKKGAVTKITPEQLELLKQDASFKFHVDKGFLVIDENDSGSDDADDYANNMNLGDLSKPKTEDDFNDPSLPQPSFNDKKRK